MEKLNIIFRGRFIRTRFGGKISRDSKYIKRNRVHRCRYARCVEFSSSIRNGTDNCLLDDIGILCRRQLPWDINVRLTIQGEQVTRLPSRRAPTIADNKEESEVSLTFIAHNIRRRRFDLANCDVVLRPQITRQNFQKTSTLTELRNIPDFVATIRPIPPARHFGALLEPDATIPTVAHARCRDETTSRVRRTSDSRSVSCGKDV